MSVATQALAVKESTPTNSIKDFLAEIGIVTRECEKIRPSGLRFRALERWRQDKSRQIAEITKRYDGNGQNALLPSDNGGIFSVDVEALEEVSGHIIKATCAAKATAEKMIRIDDFRVFGLEKGNYFTISFIVKDSQGVIKISPTYKIEYREVSIFVNVSADRPVF